MNRFRYPTFLALLCAASLWPAAAGAQSLSSLTGNNTAACPASGTLPAQCQDAWAGQTDSRSGIATPLYDRPAGNVSTVDPHGLLTDGSSTKIYSLVMLGFCTSPQSVNPTTGVENCSNNVVTGYTSNATSTVQAQAKDMINRHINGAAMNWEGDGTSEDGATLKMQSYLNGNYCSGPQDCTLMYLIMYDGPSWQYNVTSTGIPGTSGNGCPTSLSGTFTAADFENCVIAHIRNDMCYMNGYHWGNNAYQKHNGQPVVQYFPDETVIPATGSAPSWADVWVHIGEWNSDLESNCAEAPYNDDNGVPVVVFENTGGFTHEDTSGSYYWIEPANPGTSQEQVADQFEYNISPATTAGTEDYFYTTAQGYHSSQEVWGAGFKGFNSEQASWGTGRVMDQLCGQTWYNSLTAANGNYINTEGALPFLLVDTWNDYNEGTEIESGIDNCYTSSASVNGSTLTWKLTPTNSSAASLNTVDHIEIYDSPDGENLTLIDTVAHPTSTSGTYSLSGLSAGTHYLFARMVGINSVLNRMSSSVKYTN